MILLREGAEAALIIAIALTYLNRKAAGRGTRYVWASVGSTIVASLITKRE